MENQSNFRLLSPRLFLCLFNIFETLPSRINRVNPKWGPQISLHPMLFFSLAYGCNSVVFFELKLEASGKLIWLHKDNVYRWWFRNEAEAVRPLELSQFPRLFVSFFTQLFRRMKMWYLIVFTYPKGWNLGLPKPTWPNRPKMKFGLGLFGLGLSMDSNHKTHMEFEFYTWTCLFVSMRISCFASFYFHEKEELCIPTFSLGCLTVQFCKQIRIGNEINSLDPFLIWGRGLGSMDEPRSNWGPGLATLSVRPP